MHDSQGQAFAFVREDSITFREAAWTTVVSIATLLVGAMLTLLLGNRFQQSLESVGLFDVLSPFFGPFTGREDVAAIPAQAAALVSESFSVYDRLGELYPLVGIEWDLGHGNPHLPFEFPLFLPLAWVPFPVWIRIWVIGMVVCLAWSLRLMGVRPAFAYTVALGFTLTFPGQYSLVSTYPLLALALAAAWRFRDRPVIAGLSAVVFGAGRTTGLLLLLYFPWSRRWRAFTVASVTLAVLLFITLVFEPLILIDLLTEGRQAADFLFSRPDNLSAPALLSKLGIPALVTYLLIMVIGLVALGHKPLRYWTLAWLAMALSPVAWSYAVAQAFPLAVVLWRFGNLGRTTVVATGILAMGTESSYGIVWFFMVAAFGLTLAVTAVRSSDSWELRGSSP